MTEKAWRGPAAARPKLWWGGEGGEEAGLEQALGGGPVVRYLHFFNESRGSLQNQPFSAQNVGRNDQVKPGCHPPTYLGELLLELLPLLVVSLAQLLPLPDQQAQLAQRP